MDRKIVMPEDFTPEMKASHIAEVMMDDARKASVRDRLEFHVRQAEGYDNLEIESVDEAISLCDKLQETPSRLGIFCLQTFLYEWLSSKVL
jgi:hypothetical protein